MSGFEAGLAVFMCTHRVVLASFVFLLSFFSVSSLLLCAPLGACLLPLRLCLPRHYILGSSFSLLYSYSASFVRDVNDEPDGETSHLTVAEGQDSKIRRFWILRRFALWMGLLQFVGVFFSFVNLSRSNACRSSDL